LGIHAKSVMSENQEMPYLIWKPDLFVADRSSASELRVINIFKMHKCPNCLGRGICTDGTTCPMCKGSGEVSYSQNVSMTELPCWSPNEA
jgi:DnaJ-class molecular chaperone